MKRFATTALVLFFSAALPTLVFGGSVDEGARAYAKGEYSEALQILQPLAKEGNFGAQYYLGEMYRAGDGVPKNLEKAIELFRGAAAGNYPYPQLRLGAMYAAGQGVEKDNKMAYMWFEVVATLDPSFKRVFAMRDKIAGQMTPGEISEAEKMAAEWLDDHPAFGR